MTIEAPSLEEAIAKVRSYIRQEAFSDCFDWQAVEQVVSALEYRLRVDEEAREAEAAVTEM